MGLLGAGGADFWGVVPWPSSFVRVSKLVEDTLLSALTMVLLGWLYSPHCIHPPLSVQSRQRTLSLWMHRLLNQTDPCTRTNSLSTFITRCIVAAICLSLSTKPKSRRCIISKRLRRFYNGSLKIL